MKKKCSQVKICTNVLSLEAQYACAVAVSYKWWFPYKFLFILWIFKKFPLPVESQMEWLNLGPNITNRRIINTMFLQYLCLLGLSSCLTELLPWHGIFIWDVLVFICILAYVVSNKI